MSDAIKAQVARMMRWQSRLSVPVTILLMLKIVQLATGDFLGTNPPLGLLLNIATLCALLAAIVLGAITLWHIFQAGRIAFGVRSGLTYAMLAVVLLFWPGLFVIPHMVRLDVKRHFGVEPDEGKESLAEPDAPLDRPRD